jgi:hypothetical protein
MAALYYISNPAYDEIVYRAVAGLYVKPGLRVARGLSVFIEDLSKCALSDARPPDIRELDRLRQLDRRMGYWSMEEPRIPRSLELSMPTLARFLMHAFRLGMATNNPRMRGGPRQNSLFSATSAVLEAIGTKWITVDSWPTLPELPRAQERFIRKRSLGRNPRYGYHK